MGPAQGRSSKDHMLHFGGPGFTGSDPGSRPGTAHQAMHAVVASHIK